MGRGVNEAGGGGVQWRCKGSGEREEVLEGEGEGLFEVWENGVCEVGGGESWELEEEEGLAWREEQPWYVEEGEREGSRRKFA